MSTKSQIACRFSVRLLVGQGWAYLWTLTTADKIDLKELSRRWRKVIWNGFTPCVRVFERHPGGHGYHVHFVTAERLDVNELRSRTAEAGFGRIHVRRIPGARAGYIAKYLTKQRGCSPGIRMWSCVGFKGVSVGRLITSSKKTDVAHPHDRDGANRDRAYTEHVWEVDGQESVRFRIRTVDAGHAENVRRYCLTAENVAELGRDLDAGRIITVGAYRGMRVVTRRIEDGPSGMFHETARLEHLVAVGTDVRVVTEWLKIPADGKNCEPPCSWDSMVRTVLSAVGRSRGRSYWVGKVVPFSSGCATTAAKEEES